MASISSDAPKRGEEVLDTVPKGQLISECLFDFLNFPKKHRKI